jgi:DNA-binding response OmpR family regulator
VSGLVVHYPFSLPREGQPLKLPRTEFLMLSRMARNPERIVSSEDLWRSAWGGAKPHVHIYRLRGELEPHGVRIETMINVGYRLLPATGLPRL